MNRESMQKLRLDRRLIRRPGWLSQSEIDSEIEALPDSSHKAISLGEAEDDSGNTSGDGAQSPH